MPPRLTHTKIALSPAPNTSLSCSYFAPPTPTPSTPLTVFLPGLLTTSASWSPTISTLLTSPSPPYILTYDRFNIPPSDPLPRTHPANDISTAASDLTILLSKLYPLLSLPASTPLLLVGASIGCCIIRLFVAQNPAAAVRGVLLLDSYISNTDFSSLFPVPSPDETEALTRTRNIIAERFHPSVPNAEGLSRENACVLLPYASAPVFPGGPEVVVVGHDPRYNADDMEARLGIDAECYLRYVQTAWDEYNCGLARLSDKGRVVTAERAGHFIQRDRPDLVVRELGAMLRSMQR